MIAIVFGKPKGKHAVWKVGEESAHVCHRLGPEECAACVVQQRAFVARHVLMRAGYEGYVQLGTLDEIRSVRHDFADAELVGSLPVRLPTARRGALSPVPS